MRRSLAIVGAGGHGRVIADCAELLGWDRIAFYDDNAAGSALGPWAVVGTIANLLDRVEAQDEVIVGIGSNRVRLNMHRMLTARGVRMASLVHPRATVSRHARIDAGTVVFAGAVINYGAVLGQACIVNTAASVDHDGSLADGVHLSPGARLGGGVVLGECTWVGLGAAVREGVRVGRDVQIGAGAAVVAPAADDLLLVGVPAKPKQRNSNA